MGCSTCCDTNLIEEALSQAESDSGMKQLKSTEVDYVIRKISVNGKITREQLRTITKTLHISMNNDENVRCGDFFMSFQRMEECDRNSLLVTMLLLSSSPTPREKMELLFEVFDPKVTDCLVPYQILQLSKYMLEAAILHAPKLIPKHGNFDRVELAAYLTELESRLKIGTKVLTERILCGRSQLTLTQFLDAVTDKSFDTISRCGGLREFVESVESVKLVKLAPG